MQCYNYNDLVAFWSLFGRLTGRTPCNAYNFNDLVAIWSLNLFGDVPHAMLIIFNDLVAF